jgi:hypothetical protein
MLNILSSPVGRQQLGYQGPVNVLRRHRFFCAYGLLITSTTCSGASFFSVISYVNNTTLLCADICTRGFETKPVHVNSLRSRRN